MKKLIALMLSLVIAFTCFAAMSISASAAIIDGDGGITDGTDDFDDTIAGNVIDLINAIGTDFTVETLAKIEAARKAYEALTTEQKALVTNYDVLLEAEKISDVVIPGDIDGDGKVTVSDVVEMRKCIMSGELTDKQLTAGDFDGNNALTVSDVVALRTFIMNGAK